MPTQHGHCEWLRDGGADIEQIPWKAFNLGAGCPQRRMVGMTVRRCRGGARRMRAPDGYGQSVPPHVRGRTRKLTSIRFRYAYEKVQAW